MAYYYFNIGEMHQMTVLNITVYVELKDQELANVFKQAKLPEYTQISFGSATDGSVNGFPEDRGNIVITDDTALMNMLKKHSCRSLKLVFVGSSPLTDDICDVWNTADADELKARFERLLAACANEFRAWFYEHTLYTTIDTVPDMLWFKRLDGIHTMVNNAFTEVVHKTRDDVVGKDHFYIWDAPRPAEGNEFACAESEETAIRTGKMYVCDEPVKTREGMKQLTTYKTPLYDMFGNVFGTIGVGHDVTNFSNLGIELSILVENLPFPMVIFTADMKVVRMNKAFSEISETSAENAEAFRYEVWKKEALTPVGEETSDHEKHFVSREYKHYRDGKEYSYIVREQEIRDFFDNVSGYFLIMSDITYQRAYEATILKTANTDMLTGMYNRRYFYNHLSENSDKPMTLLYMDLDMFKYVNDTYGHTKGDEVLIKTANIIKTLFPKAVSARLGGDEFALVMEGALDDKAIAEYTAVLERTIQRVFTADCLPVTMSVGAVAHDGGEKITADAFMHMGDQKMYEQKKLHHGE